MTKHRPLGIVVSRFGRKTFLLIAGGLPLFTAGNAQAQGFGYGYGFFGLNPLDSSNVVNSINQRSQAAGQAAFAARQGGGSQGMSNLGAKNVRDTEFFERYDIETRRAMEARVARRPPRSTQVASNTPAPTPTPTPAAAPAPTRPPDVPISSFFNQSFVLVWPVEAPTDGDLAAKRDISDQSCLAVLNEQKKLGFATTSTVGEARTNLLDYGRPALAFIRKNSTPRIADTFHMFMLSLYEALAQAGQTSKK